MCVIGTRITVVQGRNYCETQSQSSRGYQGGLQKQEMAFDLNVEISVGFVIVELGTGVRFQRQGMEQVEEV